MTTAKGIHLGNLTEESEAELLKLPNVPIELQEQLAGRDIRGLAALLDDNRLITLMEPAAAVFVNRRMEKILVADKNVYRKLNIEALLDEYHKIVRSQSLEIPQDAATELRLLDALLVSLENEAQWGRINKRRFHLITKKHSIGLSRFETDELEELQALAEKQADTAQPLPFLDLAMLKDYARKIGINDLRT
jgi:hypothetical protein